MDFNNSLLYMPLMSGIIFVIGGLIMQKFPPKKINMMYGYRTSSSMKSKENWDFAQKYSTVLMIYTGFGLVLVSLLGLIYEVSTGKGVFIGTVELIIATLVMFYKTENAIKQKFNDEK